MTKKDYILLAGAIQESMPNDSYMERAEQYKITARKIAEALASDNPRFNYNTFYNACGLESDGIELSYIKQI